MKEKDLREEQRDAEERASSAKREFEAARSEASRETEEMRAVSGAKELKKDIKDVKRDFVVWDDARERRMYDRLDAAEAKLREWKARADAGRAERNIQDRDDLLQLEERTALARARLAEWNSAEHAREAQDSLEDAARHFDEAFEAASKRYE